MSRTSIEWVLDDAGRLGYTVNPIRAKRRRGKGQGHFCEKISPGCANCYASRWQQRLHMFPFEPKNRRFVKCYLEPDVLAEVLHRKEPTAYFWEDMSDIFGAWVPTKWIDACVATMALSPKDIHMILTKRAGRMRQYFTDLGQLSTIDRTERLYDALPRHLRPTRMPSIEFPIPRIRAGVSIENQPTADDRLPHLLRTPLWERFVSYEPALGPVTLRYAVCTCSDKDKLFPKVHQPQCLLSKPDVAKQLGRVIIGFESGPGARWGYLGWAKSMIRQCHEVELPAFMKQMGARPTTTPIGTRAFEVHPVPIIRLKLQSRKGSEVAEWPEDYRVREWPVSGCGGSGRSVTARSDERTDS